MMISTKGRYALRIMADVAQHDGEMPVSVREIAQRQDEAAQDLGWEGGKRSALVRCAALGGEQVAHALCVCLDAGVAAGGNILDAQLVGGSEQGREAGGFGILSGQSLGVEGDALHVQLL